jgi:hypothetical protein
MARRKRIYLPMTAPPWRIVEMTERKGDLPGDDLDAILDAALLDAMARQEEPEAE